MNLQYISDEQGHKVAVILPINDYEKIREKLEELEDIKAYDEAKKSGDEILPLKKALAEIENSGNNGL